MVQRVLTNIIVPTAKKYVTHPQSEAMWAKLVAKA
jgi:hypothetical protein